MSTVRVMTLSNYLGILSSVLEPDQKCFWSDAKIVSVEQKEAHRNELIRNLSSSMYKNHQYPKEVIAALCDMVVHYHHQIGDDGTFSGGDEKVHVLVRPLVYFSLKDELVAHPLTPPQYTDSFFIKVVPKKECCAINIFNWLRCEVIKLEQRIVKEIEDKRDAELLEEATTSAYTEVGHSDHFQKIVKKEGYVHSPREYLQNLLMFTPPGKKKEVIEQIRNGSYVP